MYEFRDVNQALDSVVLPSEALKINGEYIENLVKGYRTLNVTGREALSPDVVTYETGIRDGSQIKSNRFPARIIVVNYQLIAESNEAFRNAYNTLAKILNVQDAELIFNDEQDKYFTGTPCIIGTVAPGTNAVVGSFEIICTDPFKYSVVEYEATTALDDPSILVDYNGTYKAHPILEADFYNESEIDENGAAVEITGAGDCGFVAFFNEDEKIIQLGDPDEIDGSHSLEKSQTLINHPFTGQYSFGDSARELWALNSGTVIDENVQQMGDVVVDPTDYYSYTLTGTTDARIYDSDKGDPMLSFGSLRVTVKTSSRTANAVYISFTVSITPVRHIGPGMGIIASITVNNQKVTQTVKLTGTNWTWGQSHSKTFGFTYSGLGASDVSVSPVDIKIQSYDLNHNYKTELWHKCSAIPVRAYTTVSGFSGYYLVPSDYGTLANAWHGPAITRAIGPDGVGETGAKEFTLTWQQKMSVGSNSGSNKQLGAFQCQIADDTGAILAGVRIHKNLTNKQASLLLYVNGQKIHGEVIDLSYNNRNFGKLATAQTSTITKTGGKFTFTIAGITQTFTDETLAERKAMNVTFMFEKYGNSPALSYNGLYWVKFVKHNCETWKDIPNKFTANDILEADCRTAGIYLNGISTPGLGALGNDWEAFCLKPGLNQIGVAYSDWVAKEYAPTFKVRYREVFL